jgi:hypothetical protein
MFSSWSASFETLKTKFLAHLVQPMKKLEGHDWGALTKLWWNPFFTKGSFSNIKKTDEIFGVVYQKIEREKLNKMAYLHLNFRQAKHALLIKYFRWLLIFEWKIFSISQTFFRMEDGTKLSITYVVQLFKFYKMAKICLRKKLPFVSN